MYAYLITMDQKFIGTKVFTNKEDAEKELNEILNTYLDPEKARKYYTIRMVKIV